MGAAVRRFAVVGSPIEHSLSPALHRAAYAELGVPDAEYTAIEVRQGELEGLLAGHVGRDLQGLSVTMPLKPEARALATEADQTSRTLGIANTLLRRSEGTWRAENHDVHGIRASIADHAVVSPERGGVIGSGATALSAAAALVEMGARELLLTARSPQKLGPLRELASAANVRVVEVPWERAGEVLAADAVVSALAAAGARDLADRLAQEGLLAVPGVLLDVIYDPWPAPLASLLARRGVEVASGLEMLVHQAGRQVESMLQVAQAPLAQMQAAAEAELARRTG